MPEAGASGRTRTDTEVSAYVCIHVIERMGWRMEGHIHVKGVYLEALFDFDVHTCICSSVMLLKLLLELLSHILWGHIVNTASVAKHYHCRTPLPVLQSSDWINFDACYWWGILFIKVLPVDQRLFWCLFSTGSAVAFKWIWLKGITIMAFWGLLFHYSGKYSSVPIFMLSRQSD